MRLASRRWLVIIGVFAILVVVGLIIALGTGYKPAVSQNSGSHVDSFSGETVSSPPGKTPETYGTSAKPLYLGFDKLLDFGIDTTQLANVEQAFNNYSKTLASPLKQISVGTDTITTQHSAADPSSPFIILFKVQFDSKKIYQAKVQYTGLTDAQLFLADPSTSQQIFDSGIIDSSQAR